MNNDTSKQFTKDSFIYHFYYLKPKTGKCCHLLSSVVDPKLFFADPDSDPTFQEIPDPDSDPDPISDPT